MKYYTFFDLALVPILFTVLLLIGQQYQKRMIGRAPEYRFFMWGLGAKLVGGLALCFIYTFYYPGGDTVHYYTSSTAMVNLLLQDPGQFFAMYFVPFEAEFLSYFDSSTGVPVYWKDYYALNMAKFIVPMVLLGFKSYPGATLLVSAFAFSGLWKMFQMFCEIYPKYKTEIAIAILFFPSVVFWGSGILKDSFTLSAAGWYTYSFYSLFIKKRRLIPSAVALGLSIFVMLSLKPYVFLALLPGSALWAMWDNIRGIKNWFLRVLATPLIIGVGMLIGGGFWTFVSPNLGQYSSIDSMLEKAQISQLDLKREHYQGNSFDIGEFDASLQGVIAKFPVAVVAGLFRPFLWESKNVVMLLSGLENTFLLAITLVFLIRYPMFFFRAIFKDPLLLFALVFSITFAYSVGLSTSNFGALVRFKIPLLPFFVTLLLVMYRQKREQGVEKFLKANPMRPAQPA